MTYKLKGWMENSGQWPEFIDLINRNRSERLKFEKKIPLLDYPDECHRVELSPSGTPKRMRISADNGNIQIRASVRTVYYFRYFKELRFINGTPTCGDLSCVNPLHQRVANWGKEGPAAPSPILRNKFYDMAARAKENREDLVVPWDELSDLMETLPETLG